MESVFKRMSKCTVLLLLKYMLSQCEECKNSRTDLGDNFSHVISRKHQEGK